MFSCAPIYSAEKEAVVPDNGEGSVSGRVNCSQTNSDGCDGTEEPATDEDELDSVVLQLGRSMKELVLGIFKTVKEATEEN